MRSIQLPRDWVTLWAIVRCSESKLVEVYTTRELDYEITIVSVGPLGGDVSIYGILWSMHSWVVALWIGRHCLCKLPIEISTSNSESDVTDLN